MNRPVVVVRKGEVLRYHPIVGLPDYVRVRIVREPYELASGDWICKAQGLDDQKFYYPSVRALSLDSP